MNVVCPNCNVVVPADDMTDGMCSFCNMQASFHEYIVQTESGRNISYHAQSPGDARKRAEHNANQVKRVLTIEQYETLLASGYFTRQMHEREGVQS